MIIHLFKLIRPKQWIKNFFVFAPLLFSRHIFHLEYVIPSLAAFIIFSLASSAVYIINDIMDVESDRVHPKKKYRPIASGEVSVKQAMVFLVIIIAGIAVGLV
ncbi:MAG TPA: UbiA family prenyltransferase, partial [Ignavibacteria bacterium]|nr:UbiA family prenyltransferase [Ignavibacteria bacterium]